MATVTLEALSNLIHDYIAAQAKWMEEQKADHERRQAEYEKRQAEYEKEQKELKRNLGKLGNSYGEQVEAMFVNLGEKFNKLGFSFPKEASGTIKFLGENRRVLVEVDRLLENGDFVMPI